MAALTGAFRSIPTQLLEDSVYRVSAYSPFGKRSSKRTFSPLALPAA